MHNEKNSTRPSTPYLFLSGFRRAALLRGESVKKEASAVPGRQGIPLGDAGQLLEDGLWLAKQRTSPHLQCKEHSSNSVWFIKK